MKTLHAPCETCGQTVLRLNRQAIGCTSMGRCRVKRLLVTEAQCYREMIIEPLPLASKEGKSKDAQRRMTYSIDGQVGLFTMNRGGRSGLDDAIHKNSLDPEFASPFVPAKTVGSTGVAAGRLFTPIVPEKARKS